MQLALTMPQFGESITEALIVRWLKNEGDEVREQEPLVELETEKSVFSYESPFRGRLQTILGAPNLQVKVGTEIAHFEVEDRLAKKYLSMGIGREVGVEAPVAQPASVVVPKPATVTSPPSPTPSSLPPLIRSLAKEHGVPLAEVERLKGTGPGGRMTKDDFLKFLETQGSAGVASGVKVIPVSPIRARIAEKMSLSKREIPHAGTGVDADLTRIEEWRATSGKYSALAFVLFKAIPALKKFPVLNSSYRQKDGKGVIEEYPYVHLGIATATSQGLMVPVLRHADQLSFQDLVKRGTELIEKARAGRLSVEELTGGTFTVNNTGALGAIRSSQVIPPPQAGILAVNRIVRRPWVVNNEIKIRSILSLDLAFDHRLVDGDAACGFLEELRKELENFDFSVIR